MNIFLLILVSLCIVSIHANFTIVRQIPKTTILPTMRQLIFQIDQPVNPPQFQSFIHIWNATTNGLIYQIDVYTDTVNVTYSNNTLTFNISQFNINDEFYITFDAGVLFSNMTVNSTAETDPNFWHLKVVDLQTSTSVTNTVEYTSIGTTQLGSTGTSMTYSGTSAITATITYTAITQTTQNLNTTSTTAGTMITGEPSPTRSAQIGMGLGITFITVLIIIEIIYFKFCYSGNGRSGSYFT